MVRFVKVLTIALPLAGAALALGIVRPAEAECASIACTEQDGWVCCSPSSSDCDSYKIDYCNSVAGSDPFDQECGWN